MEDVRAPRDESAQPRAQDDAPGKAGPAGDRTPARDEAPGSGAPGSDQAAGGDRAAGREQAAASDRATGGDSTAAGETGTETPLRAPDLVRWCITLLASAAWQAMGLVPDPSTHKVERHLDDARLAIDAAAALILQLRPRLSDAEQREFDTLLTNLRLNFVEQQAKG